MHLTPECSESARLTARRVYRPLEPIHVQAYFGAPAADALDRSGLNPLALRGNARRPLGPCSDAVASASIYTFAPPLVDEARGAAVDHGLERIAGYRGRVVDSALRRKPGEAATPPDSTIVNDMENNIARAEMSGAHWPRHGHARR